MKHEERRSGEEERRRRVISSPTTSSVTGIPSSSRAMDIVLERNSDAPSSSPLFFSFFLPFFHFHSFFPAFTCYESGPTNVGLFSRQRVQYICSRLPAETKDVIIIYRLWSVWSLTISIPMAHSCQMCTQATFWRTREATLDCWRMVCLGWIFVTKKEINWFNTFSKKKPFWNLFK